jgi:hypothetical protein
VTIVRGVATVATTPRPLPLSVVGSCDCSCDVHSCPLLCCSLGGASALVTFICVAP